MKKLLLFVSVAVAGFAAFYFAQNLKYSTDVNYIVYMATWVVLFLIAIVGVIFFLPSLRSHRHHVKNLIYNSYSNRRVANKEFDRHYHIFN